MRLANWEGREKRRLCLVLKCWLQSYKERKYVEGIPYLVMVVFGSMRWRGTAR